MNQFLVAEVCKECTNLPMVACPPSCTSFLVIHFEFHKFLMEEALARNAFPDHVLRSALHCLCLHCQSRKEVAWSYVECKGHMNVQCLTTFQTLVYMHVCSTMLRYFLLPPSI